MSEEKNEPAEMKSWQRGYDLDTLKELVTRWDPWNRFSLSPFSEVTKDKVAEWLAEGRLGVVEADSRPFVRREILRDSVVNAYNSGSPVAYQARGDLEVSRIAGLSPELIDMIEHRKGAVWVVHWTEDQSFVYKLTKRLEALGMKLLHVGNKYSTFAEIFGYYLVQPKVKEGGLLPVMRIPPNTGGLDSVSCVSVPLQDRKVDLDWNAKKVNESIVQKTTSLEFGDHYSNYNKDRSWSAISLRGYGPDPAFYYKPDEMPKKWKASNPGPFKLQDTPLMDKFPEIRDNHVQLFKNMGCLIQRVRLMKLEPGGGELDRHTDQVDHELGTDVGQVMRIHFPILTNPDVRFTAWKHSTGEEILYHMGADAMHYLDIRKPHKAVNAGTTPRIHLVIDVVATPKLLDVFKPDRKGLRIV